MSEISKALRSKWFSHNKVDSKLKKKKLSYMCSITSKIDSLQSLNQTVYVHSKLSIISKILNSERNKWINI